MELPPGWRGYGAKDYIDHPDTPARAEAVAKLRESLSGSDRFAVQEALMPFRHLRSRSATADATSASTSRSAPDPRPRKEPA